MIAFYDPPKTDDYATHAALHNKELTASSAAYLDHVWMVFSKAIVEANGGQAASQEDLQRWCQTFVDQDGAHHLLWKAPPMQEGEKVDMGYVIASVPPPKVFKSNHGEL